MSAQPEPQAAGTLLRLVLRVRARSDGLTELNRATVSRLQIGSAAHVQYDLKDEHGVSQPQSQSPGSIDP